MFEFDRDVQTMTAARILKGQKVDGLKFGEETSLYLESFPYTGFGKARHLTNFYFDFYV